MYETFRRWFRLSLRVFFRQIQVEGIDNVPTRGGGIIIAWHPNAVIDGMLLAAECPRPITFGARHGLLDVPLLGWVMRRTGTVPIYRACDTAEQEVEARRAANTRSLGKLAEAVANGRLTALFPEGLSHDAPHPVALKTGAARLYDMARELGGNIEPFVLPVALHYGAKDRGRSTVLVRFYPPMNLPDELTRSPAREDDDARYARLRALTDLFERTIHEAVLATEDWQSHRLMHRTRKLIRAELAHRRESDPGPATPSERRAGFARVWTAYRAVVERNPAGAEVLSRRLVAYDRELREIRLEDHQLDRIGSSSGLAFWLASARALVLVVLLAPLALVGYVTNGPTALLLFSLAHALGRAAKDRATIKVLVGMLVLPITWITVGFLTGYGATFLAPSKLSFGITLGIGVVAALVTVLGVPAVFLFARILSEGIRRVRVRASRIRHGETIDRLRRQRAALFDSLIKESQDLELPGNVLFDGRVEPEPK
jgi:1-acyl-sn-glycerol-3-phosphate acyltransferase